jgi:hypothetical protein
MRLCLSIAAAAALSGCATYSTPVEVPVPVAVPCINWIPERPNLYAAEAWERNADVFERLKALKADRVLLIAHADRLEALLVACAEGKR